MTKKHKKFIISLLICTSFSIYGSTVANFSDSSADTKHNPTNVTPAANKNMTREQLVNFFSDVHAMSGIYKGKLPSLFANIADSQWSHFIDWCDKLNLINKSSSSLSIIFNIASNVTAEQLSSFVNICDGILPSVYEQNQSDAIRIVATTEHTKWSALADIFDRVKNGVDLMSRSDLLSVLSVKETKEYLDLLKYYTIITPSPGSSNIGSDPRYGSLDSNLIIALASSLSSELQKVDDINLPNFFNTVKAMGNTSIQSMKYRISALANTPAAMWRDIVSTLSMIERNSPNLDKDNRYYAEQIVMKNLALLHDLRSVIEKSPMYFNFVSTDRLANIFYNTPTNIQSSEFKKILNDPYIEAIQRIKAILDAQKNAKN